jgi:hypothetical protein
MVGGKYTALLSEEVVTTAYLDAYVLSKMRLDTLTSHVEENAQKAEPFWEVPLETYVVLRVSYN